VRFKLDENLPVELLEDLRAAGHEADGLRDEGLIGAPDDVVLDLVRREHRVLPTLAPPSCSCGVTWRISSSAS
jgi:predicted nuclease of predicted toxin-antitoxin system